MILRKHIALLAACTYSVMSCQTALAQEDIMLSPKADVTPPKIEHEPAAESVTGTEPVTLTATVKDDSGVKEVTLFSRSGGEGDFKPTPMKDVGDGRYEATIQADGLAQPNLEYYIQAVDGAGNTVLRAGKFFPLKIAVVPQVGGGEVLSTAEGEGAPQEEKKSYWGWVLGAVAIGALAALAGGDDGGSAPPPDGGPGGGGATTGTLTVTAPAP